MLGDKNIVKYDDNDNYIDDDVIISNSNENTIAITNEFLADRLDTIIVDDSGNAVIKFGTNDVNGGYINLGSITFNNDYSSYYRQYKGKLINLKMPDGTIKNFFYDVIYNDYGTKGDDFIYNDEHEITSSFDDIYENVVNIYAGAGNDTVIANGPKISINSGSGNDYIESYNSSGDEDATINAGKGNDIIYSDGVIQYAKGDGNDTICSYGGNIVELEKGTNIISAVVEGTPTTIQAGYGYYTVGENLVLNIGAGTDKGSITFKDRVSACIRTKKDNGDYDCYYYFGDKKYNDITPIYQYIYDGTLPYSDTLITGTDDSDFAYLFGFPLNSTLNAKGGDDYILLDNGCSNAQINAGAGNDTIQQIGGDYYYESTELDEYNEPIWISDGTKMAVPAMMLLNLKLLLLQVQLFIIQNLVKLLPILILMVVKSQ